MTMSFLNARVIESTVEKQGDTVVALVYVGEITDSTTDEVYRGVVRIEGEQLANLPTDPAARFGAIKDILAADAKARHAEWMEGVNARRTVVPRPKEEIANFPVLTSRDLPK